MNTFAIVMMCVLAAGVVFSKMSSETEACSAKTAVTFGGIVAAALVVVAAVVGVLYQFVFAPAGLEGLYYVALPVAVLLVFGLASVLVKPCKPMLPLAAVVCTLLGILIACGDSFVSMLLNSVMTGILYIIVVVLMAGVNSRIRFSKIPAALKGVPISIVAAGLMAIAFMGITGLH